MNRRNFSVLALALVIAIFGWVFARTSQSLAQDDSVVFQEGNTSEEATGEDQDDGTTVTPRALWVWSTQEILKDSGRRVELFAFCQNQRVDTIWLQLLYDVRQLPLDKSKSLCTIREQHEFRRLLREAHGAGIKVHALDGYPEFALTEYHSVPLAIVEALLDFNETSEQDERFDGVHFDNEPYALVGWQSKSLRPQIITEFLILNQKCKAVADRQEDFEFGIDIPVWWHQTGDAADPTLAQFAFDGTTRTLAEHCLQTVDNIGIMNYRDTASGPDGIIENGQAILDSAAKLAAERRPKVLMGVETVAPVESQVWFAIGLPRGEFEYAVELEDNPMSWRSRFNGVRLRTFDDGDNVHVGIELPDDRTRSSAQFHQTLRTLIKSFGAGSRSPVEISDYAKVALDKMSSDPEHTSSRAFLLRIQELEDDQPGILTKSVMLAKISFGDNDSARLNSELAEAEQTFSKNAAFGGMAIHSFESAREMK